MTQPERLDSRSLRTRRTLMTVVLLGVALAVACHRAKAPEPVPVSRPAPIVVRPVLSDHFLVTWYGNPRTSRMGVLGRHQGAELAAKLRQQADEYSRFTTKK